MICSVAFPCVNTQTWLIHPRVSAQGAPCQKSKSWPKPAHLKITTHALQYRGDFLQQSFHLGLAQHRSIAGCFVLERSHQLLNPQLLQILRHVTSGPLTNSCRHVQKSGVPKVGLKWGIFGLWRSKISAFFDVWILLVKSCIRSLLTFVGQTRKSGTSTKDIARWPSLDKAASQRTALTLASSQGKLMAAYCKQKICNASLQLAILTALQPTDWIRLSTWGALSKVGFKPKLHQANSFGCAWLCGCKNKR